ncbi:MAG TPA: hypothetical protein VEO91_00030 [Candidatus Limnocylindria bacterium]|nr:hypothetical protein [Candidatus Limnocylindria bacterium]
MRRIRSLLIALVLLALSAGAVFAFRPLPSAATDGLSTAGAAAGMSVPARPDAPPAVGSQQPAASDEDADEDTGPSEQATHPDNHGAAVSEAARAATPDGIANHGVYVSSIALDNAGQATARQHRQTPTVPNPAVPTPANPAGR